MKTESIKLGIVTEPSGAHLDLYLKSIGNCQGIGQVAIADTSGRSFEAAKKVLGGAHLDLFLDYHEMIKGFKPGMVLITLEPHHSPLLIETALEANCHVLSEKPACVRIEDFDRLVHLAKLRQRHLMLTLANRLSPQVKKAKGLVQSGFLGKLYGANLYLIADQTRLTKRDYQRSWRAIKTQAGGGHLIWLGIHWLDLIQYISGDRIRQVCGFSENVGGQPIEVEDAAVMALKFEKGMVGTLQSGYYLDRNYHTQIAIWGSEGWLRCDLMADMPMQWYSTHSAAPQGIQFFSDTTDFLSNQYLPLVQAAVNAARDLQEPPITGDEALHVLKVIFALYRAAETGSTQIVS